MADGRAGACCVSICIKTVSFNASLARSGTKISLPPFHDVEGLNQWRPGSASQLSTVGDLYGTNNVPPKGPIM